MSNDALTHPTDALAHRPRPHRAEAATTAGYAPSIHNTQPWRWRLTGDRLDLFTERSRVLDVTDPDARLATLSCGAALHHARVSLAAQGWRATVTRHARPRRPRPSRPATASTGRAPGRPAGRAHRADHPAAPHRPPPRDRSPRSDPRSSHAITTAVEAEGTWLHVLSPDQVLDLAAAADHAQRTEAAESAWQDELAYWTGGTRPTGTGIPDAAIPDQATQTTVPGRDFGHHGDLPDQRRTRQGSGVRDPLRPRRRTRWTGSAPARPCPPAGSPPPNSASPCCRSAPPIEIASTRQAMRVLLASVGHPYLVLRLGTIDPDDAGPAARPPAARRPDHRTAGADADTVTGDLAPPKDTAPGLSSQEAAARLARDGGNILPQRPTTPLWRRVVTQLRDPLVLVLLAAAVFTLATGDFTDAGVILFVIVVNTTVGVIQEVKAERAITALSAADRTRRPGGPRRHPREVPAADLVVGDLLVLAEGDIVPADARIVEAAALLVDEAALTGESAPVDKHARADARTPRTSCCPRARSWSAAGAGRS